MQKQVQNIVTYHISEGHTG